MLVKLLITCVPVVVNVVMHAVGFAVLLRALIRSHTLTKSGFLPLTGLVICLTCWLLLIHLAEIAVWGLSHFWLDCLPDAESAFYFAGATYTIVGYGDVVLPRSWRMLAPVEALTGILMCGLSTGLFFTVVNRQIGNWWSSFQLPNMKKPLWLAPFSWRSRPASAVALRKGPSGGQEWIVSGAGSSGTS